MIQRLISMCICLYLIKLKNKDDNKKESRRTREKRKNENKYLQDLLACEKEPNVRESSRTNYSCTTVSLIDSFTVGAHGPVHNTKNSVPGPEDRNSEN